MNLRASQLETLRAVEQLENSGDPTLAFRVSRILRCSRDSALVRLGGLVATGYLRDNYAPPRYRHHRLTDQGRAALAQEGKTNG